MGKRAPAMDKPSPWAEKPKRWRVNNGRLEWNSSLNGGSGLTHFDRRSEPTVNRMVVEVYSIVIVVSCSCSLL
jgi:hypothetical protein